MRTRSNRVGRRPAFTLIELIVVVGIILAVAALAAAFAPRVNENTNLSRSVDTVEQVLLTAKLRAKRDQLATGVRFISGPGDTPNVQFSQFVYIQQPDPLSGGWISTTQTTGSVAYSAGPPPLYLTGGIITTANAGTVNFANVDFSLGGIPTNEWLVQAGDFLEVRDGGVFMIGSVGATSLTLAGTSYDNSFGLNSATTNYRILRQPRLLTGEPPVALPGTFAVDFSLGGNVALNTSKTAFEILFAPSGAVVGTNAANGKTLMIVRDPTDTTNDPNHMGIVGVQGRTGFIGAYSVAPGADPFLYAEEGRTSGL